MSNNFSGGNQYSGLVIINALVYAFALLGSVIYFFASFGQCLDGGSDCSSSNKFNNYTQMGLSVGSALVATLIHTLILTFERYVYR